MKKFLCILCALFIILTSAYADEEFLSVCDDGGMISAPVEKYIYTQNRILSEETGARIIVATDDNTGELSVTEYAEKIYDQLGVRHIGRGNSVFLFVCEEADDYHIIVSDAIGAVLTEEYTHRILVDCMEKDFAKGNYDEAVIKTFNALGEWYCEKYGIQLELTENMKEYSDIIRTETNERKLKIFIVIFAVLVAVIAFFWVMIRIRRKKISEKLRKRRQERRKRYMQIK